MRQVREVLRLTTVGVGLNEIARRVGIAPSTVRLTLKRLASSISCRPRTSANPASATTPSFQFKRARWSWAAGITAYGHWSRQKRDIRRNQVDRTLFSRNDVSKGTT